MFKPVAADVTDEEVRYYSEHPDEIDEFTAPVNVHKAFLWIGALLGTFCVAFSKMLKYTTFLDFLPGAVNEFLVDIVFEIGVALIGAAVTAYILGILLNQQQENAAKWRAEIWRRIGLSENEAPPPDQRK
jgi:hypothetical protein